MGSMRECREGEEDEQAHARSRVKLHSFLVPK